MKTIPLKNIKRLLIRSTNWIGDAIMTTPCVTAIRNIFPDAKIYMLTKPWVAPVFEHSPYIDHLIIYDGSGRHKGMIGKIRLAKDLRPYRFNGTILLQNAFEAALITFLAGISIRLGYNRDARRLLLSHPVPCTQDIKKEHQTRYYLNILKSAGFKTGNPGLYLQLGQKDKIRGKEILDQNGISSEDKLVGINPGATYGPAKQWPMDRYAALADRIQESTGARIIIFGGPGDINTGQKISRLMKHKPVDLSGSTRLGEAMSLIKKCALFITNDSGLMHVAAALDVPLVAIFGSTNVKTTGPLGQKSRVVQVPTACNPCLKPECPEGHLNCMKKISVDMVFHVTRKMF